MPEPRQRAEVRASYSWWEFPGRAAANPGVPEAKPRGDGGEQAARACGLEATGSCGRDGTTPSTRSTQLGVPCLTLSNNDQNVNLLIFIKVHGRTQKPGLFSLVVSFSLFHTRLLSSCCIQGHVRPCTGHHWSQLGLRVRFPSWLSGLRVREDPVYRTLTGRRDKVKWNNRALYKDFMQTAYCFNEQLRWSQGYIQGQDNFWFLVLKMLKNEFQFFVTKLLFCIKILVHIWRQASYRDRNWGYCSKPLMCLQASGSYAHRNKYIIVRWAVERELQ